MDLTGSHILNADTNRIWAMLMDTDTLARIVPGITRLEKTAENEYKAVAEIKMGPVSGSFSGGLTLQDIREGEGYTLHVKQSSKIGNADATIRIDLKPTDEGHTELVFDGGAKLSGLLARTGNRVMSGVAHTLTKQFFNNFEQEIETV
ncbi:CoxG family protein [Arundinibacter roseus]|uniref:Carbon monoxide dehydrogenase n=1 Tax=Arundinibacter roseus TaxID=2070510 RepID=A0A4V2XA10_9BACT|nr:carbon monoxide dehydrogenase subunit G [Arundinibacter roseus]TDB65865.1 carbon monoxide dehydrogenase [Arundinibacter roseus]